MILYLFLWTNSWKKGIATTMCHRDKNKKRFKWSNGSKREAKRLGQACKTVANTPGPSCRAEYGTAKKRKELKKQQIPNIQSDIFMLGQEDIAPTCLDWGQYTRTQNKLSRLPGSF